MESSCIQIKPCVHTMRCESPVGRLIIGYTNKGVCFLGITAGDTSEGMSEEQCMEELKKRFSGLTIDRRKSPQIARELEKLFCVGTCNLALDIHGSQFEMKVWNQLLKIPRGVMCSYSQVADAIGEPSAVRAVASAIGRNPVSILIPCHRVVTKSGTLGGYHWGLRIKKELLRLENLY